MTPGWQGEAYHHSDPHISGKGLGVGVLWEGVLWERLGALQPTVREMWLFSLSEGDTSDLKQSSLDSWALPCLAPLSLSFPHSLHPKEKEGETGLLI